MYNYIVIQQIRNMGRAHLGCCSAIVVCLGSLTGLHSSGSSTSKRAFYLPELLSRWSLIIQQSSLGFLTAWQLGSKRENTKATCSLTAYAWNSYSVTSATFCWSEQITRPLHIHEHRKQTPSLDGMTKNFVAVFYHHTY